MALDAFLTHWHAWRAAPGICGPHVDIDLEGVLFLRLLVILDRRQFLAVGAFPAVYPEDEPKTGGVGIWLMG
jgi:hypothetical protein